MRVRMTADVSGSRNGVPWPKRGGTVDVPDDEGAELCESGVAEPVAADSDDVETATLPDNSEKRALTTETAAAVTPGAPASKPAAPAKPRPTKKAPAKKTAPAKPTADAKPTETAKKTEASAPAAQSDAK